jgi:hypothetical protein
MMASGAVHREVHDAHLSPHPPELFLLVIGRDTYQFGIVLP